MNTLLTSDSFWILALTVLAFFISYCYLGSLYSSFNIPWGNVTVSEVLIKGVPALGVLVVLLVYGAEPVFPWHAYVKELALRSSGFVRFLLPAVTVSAIVAIGIGKFNARLLRRSRRCVDIETEQRTLRNVIIVAFGKDLIALFDPATKNTVLVPWGEVKRIEAKKLQREKKDQRKKTTP